MEVRGCCSALYAYDIGLSIDLDRAEARLLEERRRTALHGPRRTPEPGQMAAPLRITQLGQTLDIGRERTSGAVDLVLYEFGAVCIRYPLPLSGKLEDLVALSDVLYDNEALEADSRARVEQLLRVLGDAVEKPRLSELSEDYAIFEIQPDGDMPIEELWTTHGATVARILRAQPSELSEQEQSDALSQRTSYTPRDAALVDWFGALLYGDEMSDERYVLEFAVVELLELRWLDAELDAGIDAAYDVLSRKRGWLESLRTPRERDVHRISQLQADGALLFEGVNNALKLLGDQYLARLYRVISDRLHLSEWDQTIERKQNTLESIYGKLADRANARRVEVLEWIIIVLIAISIGVYFLPQ